MNAFVRDGSIVFIILNDGMILASDRQHDALVPDLAPQRIRDELELLQLPLHALELVGEGDRRVEPLRGLFVHGLGNFHDITHVEGHVLGPDRPADESADDIEEHVLLEILGPINLESFLLVDDDGQDSGEYVLNPFVSWAEVEAEHLDDAIGIIIMAQTAQNSNKNAPKKRAKRTKKVLSDAELAAKLLKKERQREAEVARVRKANAEHLKATRTSVPPVVAPRTKPSTNHLAHVRIGERVQVMANTSPGYNRPAGSGYVQVVTGTGAETVVSVKYDAVFGGLLHHDVPYDDITIILFGQEFLQPNLAAGRAKREVPVVDEPMAASESDRRHPIFDLLERLNDGYSSGKPKGFHRAELGLGKPGSKQMNDAEN